MDKEPLSKLLLQLNGASTIFQKEELKAQLIEFINQLLLNDFNYLIQILYRVDVDEEKLKGALQQNPGIDAAVLIADLLMERQAVKLNIKQFKRDTGIPENEKW